MYDLWFLNSAYLQGALFESLSLILAYENIPYIWEEEADKENQSSNDEKIDEAQGQVGIQVDPKIMEQVGPKTDTQKTEDVIIIVFFERLIPEMVDIGTSNLTTTMETEDIIPDPPPQPTLGTKLSINIQTQVTFMSHSLPQDQPCLGGPLLSFSFISLSLIILRVMHLIELGWGIYLF